MDATCARQASWASRCYAWIALAIPQGVPWAIITGAGSALGRSTPALAGALAASRDIDPAAVAPVLTGEPFRLNIEAQHLLGHFGLNFCQSI